MSPRVTIGIPVYNGADTLRRAVESALAQTRPGVVIHISDNASTDATSAIGRELAAWHPSVTYTRHDTSLGLSGNFAHVLDRADTEYFMWLAADDAIEPAYVERTLAELERDPGLVACVSRAVFVRPDGTSRPVGGTFPLMADTATNLAAYLSGPSDNTRIFSLYRTRALRSAFPRRYFHAYDWAVAAGTLLHGRHMELPETLMVRDETPGIAYVKAVRRDNPPTVWQLFPVLGMTLDLLWRQRIPLRWAIVKALLRINLELHLNYALLFHPRYAKRVDRLLRHYILWKLVTPPSSAAPAAPS